MRRLVILIALLWLLPVVGLWAQIPEFTFVEPVTMSEVHLGTCNFDEQGCYPVHHTGIDYISNSGNPDVYATNAGTIALLVTNGIDDHNMGNVVIIEHTLLNGSTVYSLYAHLNSFENSLYVGKTVCKGEKIGVMGATGNGSGNSWADIHLHFEMKDSPVLHNPSGSGTYWGYTPSSALNYGYQNPNNYYGTDQVIPLYQCFNCFVDPISMGPGDERDDEVCVNTFQQYSFPVIADGRTYRISVIPNPGTDVDLFSSRDKTDIETLDALQNWSTTCDVGCASSETSGEATEIVSFTAPTDGVDYTNWFSVLGKAGPDGMAGYHVKVEVVGGGLDVVFIMDLTGSTGGLLPTWQAQMPSVVADIQARFPGARFGLASHLDYPFSPYGASGEYAYRLESPLNVDPGPMLTSLASLTNGWGRDTPESQYEAIYQALTGEGRDLNSDGDFTDIGEIQPGDMGYASGSKIALFHFTYPPIFHNWDLNPNYPYAGAAPVAGRIAAITACLSKPMFYFGLVTSTARSGIIDEQTGEVINEADMLADDPMQELADTTGGAILYVGSDLSGLDVAIEAALEVVDPSVFITPDSLAVYQANSVQYNTVSITIGGTLSEALLNIDPSTLMINNTLAPQSATFLGDEWLLIVSTSDFIHSYPAWVGVRERTFSVSGSFLTGNTFAVEGSFISVGHLAGDLDASGIVDISDLTVLISYLFKGIEIETMVGLADVNYDDAVNVSDLACLVSHLFRGTSIPCDD